MFDLSEPLQDRAGKRYNTAVSQNKAENGYGGGAYVEKGGTLEIENGSSISGNTATNAGGVWMQGNQVTLSNSFISDNKATGEAGGVVVISGSTFTMESGEISGNTAATGMGGGVENLGTFNMKGGTITDNEATQKATADDEIAKGIGVGGGVANVPGGTFTMSETAKLYGNTAGYGGDDFYNYGPEPEDDGNQNVGTVVDPGWGNVHYPSLESLSATTRTGDEIYGTFTLLDPEGFDIEGAEDWYNDEPTARYEETEDPDVYEIKNNDTSLQYLTLGVEPPEEADLIVWYYQVYLDEGDGTWLLWKHGQGGWAAPTATVEIEAADFEGQSLGWGDAYVYDNTADNRLESTAKETHTAPLKIYFEKKS